jgi:hypothetical protein
MRVRGAGEGGAIIEIKEEEEDDEDECSVLTVAALE